MSHESHERLPGYHPDQILVDGCGECEARAQYRDRGICTLDIPTFARAWTRARERELRGLPTCSEVEEPLLAVLWAVAIQLERAGVIGELHSAMVSAVFGDGS